MVPRTFNLRFLVWLCIAILAIVVVWQWFAPTTQTPLTPLPEPTAPVPHSTKVEATPPVDALWERYQQLNSIDAASTLRQSSTHSDTSIAMSSQTSAEAEKQQRRIERQEARTQRLHAIQAAQTQVNQALAAIKPGDTANVITAIEQFDSSLNKAGVDIPIDMESLKRLLITSGRLNQLNTMLLSEADRGSKANPEKLRQLSQEIQQLLPQLQPVTVKRPVTLREGK